MFRYDSPDEIVQFTDEVFRPEVQRAGLGEGGELRPGGLMEAAARNDRSVAHAVLLCANRRGINMLTKKRPDLIEVEYSIVQTHTVYKLIVWMKASFKLTWYTN